MSSYTNREINNLITLINKNSLTDIYKKEDLIVSTNTTTIANTIISFNRELSILFCKICSSNLFKDNTLKHLKEKHKVIFKEYISKDLIISIKEVLDSLECPSFNSLLTNLGSNSYFFRELNIIFNGYKCYECSYSNANSKQIRKHYRKEHRVIEEDTRSNTKATYILENIPLQLITRVNTRSYFIPKLPTKDIVDNFFNINTRATSPLVIMPTSSNISRRVDISSRVRDNIVSSYREELEEEQENTNYINVNNNANLLTSFFRNSNILEFFRDKDKSILRELIASPYFSSIALENPLNSVGIDKLDLLEDTILEIALDISNKLGNLSRKLRQLLRDDMFYTTTKKSKDFLALDNLSTKREYFSLYTRLITYTIRVYYIKDKYKNSLEPREQEIFKVVKDIRTSREISRAIDNILELDRIETNTISLESNKESSLAITKLFDLLLKDLNYLSTNRNTTLDNIVITFFFINTLNKETLEFYSVNKISKLTSMFIYNSRLFFIAYYFTREEPREESIEEIEDEDEDEQLESNRRIDTIIAKDIKKLLTNNSNNYFEELTQLRSYTRALDRNTISENFSISEIKPNVIEYNNLEYPITTLREFFNYLLTTLETTLKTKLLGLESFDTLNINYRNINDTSLLNKTDNSIRDLSEFTSFKTYFLTNLLTPNTYYNSTLVRSINSTTNKIVFIKARIEEFNSNINYFLELLSIAFNLLSGGPLRGTELNKLIYKNIATKRRSLLYIKDENIFRITSDYYKSRNIKQQDIYNYRFIPPRLSRVTLIYLLTIIPFKDYIYKEYYKEERE